MGGIYSEPSNNDTANVGVITQEATIQIPRNIQESAGEQQSETGNEQQEDDIVSVGNGIPLPVLLIIFGGAAYMARKRMIEQNLYQGRWIVGTNDPDGYNYGDEEDAIARSNKGNEMVPLSNEDEWGWEDNAKKDIELGGKPSNNIDSSSDLNSVLANSVHSGASSNNDSHRKSVGSDTTFQTTNVSGVRLTSSIANKRPSVIKTGSGKAFEPTPLENIASGQEDSWDEDDDWDDNEDNVGSSSASTYSIPTPIPVTTPTAPVPTSAPAPPPTVEELLAEQLKNSHAPAITSFSQTKSAQKTKVDVKKPKKNGEDDIFASMGLSSIPTKTEKPKPKNVSSTTNKTSWKTETLNDVETADVGSDWGGDDDLDDLLDD